MSVDPAMEQQLSVLLLTHYFEPENGAPQRRWRSFIARLVQAGIHVDVIAPSPHHPSGRRGAFRSASLRPGASVRGEHGGTVHRVSFLPHDGGIVLRTLDHIWVASMTILRAGKLVRSGTVHPDVLVATVPALPTLLAAWWVSRRHRLPLVIEMRDAWPDLLDHTPGLRRSRSLKAAVKRHLASAVTVMQRRADLVVTTTASFATVLEDRGVRDPEVIRNGTIPELYEAIGPSSERDDGPLRVLYMGTLGRSQGLEVVLEAAAVLKAEGAAVEVRIVGEGADLPSLRRLNARLGAPVDIRPAVAPAEVSDHYRWADTCVVSLRDWGPFEWTVPSKLYELMATGRHVTAILRGEGAQIVRDSAAGTVVPPGDASALADAWRGLATNRAALAVGIAGQRWVREHADFRRLGERYAAALRRLGEGDRGRR